MGKQTRFETVLSKFGHIARKYSIVFILSDFLTHDYRDELGALAGRHDVNAINLTEKPDRLTTCNELIHIRDVETDSSRVIDLKDTKTKATPHHEILRDEMLEAGINLMEITPEEDCAEALISFFRSRQQELL